MIKAYISSEKMLDRGIFCTRTSFKRVWMAYCFASFDILFLLFVVKPAFLNIVKQWWNHIQAHEKAKGIVNFVGCNWTWLYSALSWLYYDRLETEFKTALPHNRVTPESWNRKWRFKYTRQKIILSMMKHLCHLTKPAWILQFHSDIMIITMLRSI